MSQINKEIFSSKITNDPSDKAKFPSDFVWGAATSSYQI